MRSPSLKILSLLITITMLLSTLISCTSKATLQGDESLQSSNNSTSSDSSQSASETVDSSADTEKAILQIFSNGAYDVQVIRPDIPSKLEISIYNQLRNILNEKTSVKPSFETDFVDAGKQPYDGPAILIGQTSYKESQEAYAGLEECQATATLSGNKYVIAFSSQESAGKLLVSLISLLSKNATTDNITITSDWEINVKAETTTMTKAEWINQYKSELSERDIALLTRSYEILEKNTLHDKNMPWGDNPVISPWSGSTAGIWNWDSVFHAMTVCRYDGELAKSCIDAIAMFQRENGLIPDVVYHDGKIMDNYSKPPVFAWGVLEVFKATYDLDFLRRNHECAAKYESFWRNERFDDGLFYYSAQVNPENDDYLHPRWESGWDNSPRWDVAPIVDLYPIDLNCYMVLYYRSMAEMADILGFDSAEWKSRETALTNEIEARLYNDAIDAYVDRNRKNGEYSTVLSPAGFMPLFIGIASSERANSMNKIARDATKFYPGMPSVSYDNNGYNNDYWRGPTWLNIAFFAVKGLDNYGFDDTSAEIKEFILNMCYDGLPYIYENYDSKTETGKCVKEFSWSAAFIIEFILQINED